MNQTTKTSTNYLTIKEQVREEHVDLLEQPIPRQQRRDLDEIARKNMQVPRISDNERASKACVMLRYVNASVS